MKREIKQAYYDALTNASEMIRGHVETGIMEDDFEGDYTLNEYQKQCVKASKTIDVIAAKYKEKHKL